MVAIWVAVVFASFPAIAVFLGDVLTADIETTAETESKRAERLIHRAFPESRAARERHISEVVVVRVRRRGIGDPAAVARVAALSNDLRAAGASAVVTTADGTPLRSRDGDARAVLVGLGFDGEDDVPAVHDVVQRLDDEPGYQAAITGELTSDADQEELSGDDLRTGELFFGLPAALVILLLVFGAVVAGLVPLILAIVSIVVALALAALLGQAYDLSLYTVNMLTGMGLALGIDYSLFVVSRYREERLHGRRQLDAIAATAATANRAVLFSGMTFALAMFGLVLVPNTIFRSLAAGAILVGIVSALAALTLLPALLGLLGDRINALRIPFFGRAAEQAGSESRFWGQLVRAVVRRPVVSLVLGGGLMLALALPALGLETGSQGRSTLPDRFESKRAISCSTRSFPAGRPIPSRSPSPATRPRHRCRPGSRGSRPSSRGDPSSRSRRSRRARPAT